jgi:hypothetical protein
MGIATRNDRSAPARLQLHGRRSALAIAASSGRLNSEGACVGGAGHEYCATRPNRAVRVYLEKRYRAWEQRFRSSRPDPGSSLVRVVRLRRGSRTAQRRCTTAAFKPAGDQGLRLAGGAVLSHSRCRGGRVCAARTLLLFDASIARPGGSDVGRTAAPAVMLPPGGLDRRQCR